MPALKGIKQKEMFGYQVDKENDDVIYSDGPHIYLSKKDGSRYISVTTLIGELNDRIKHYPKECKYQPYFVRDNVEKRWL